MKKKLIYILFILLLILIGVYLIIKGNTEEKVDYYNSNFNMDNNELNKMNPEKLEIEENTTFSSGISDKPSDF